MDLSSPLQDYENYLQDTSSPILGVLGILVIALLIVVVGVFIYRMVTKADAVPIKEALGVDQLNQFTDALARSLNLTAEETDKLKQNTESVIGSGMGGFRAQYD